MKAVAGPETCRVRLLRPASSKTVAAPASRPPDAVDGKDGGRDLHGQNTHTPYRDGRPVRVAGTAAPL